METGRAARVSGYRWAVLGVFMLVNLAIQVLWISYAPVTGRAAAYYGVDDLGIGLFAMVFMLAFIPLSIPASWLIDGLGFRVAVGAGSVLMGIAGVARGLVGESYAGALAASLGLAAAQPFLLNAWTKVPALWFPRKERATAVGLVTLSNLTGTAIGMVLTPVLAERLSLPAIQLRYGIFAAACTLAFLLVARERPKAPPEADEAGAEGGRALMLEGLRHALSLPSFRRYLAVSFIGLGIFNGVTTWIEAIVRPRGVGAEEAGLLGAAMLVSGVLGAVLVPPLSDRSGRRTPYLAFCLAAALPGLAGLAFAPNFPLLLASAALLGFFLTAAMPIGMQYASEIARPTPEGSSNGLIQLFGQASVVFVYVMEALRTASGSFAPSLLLAMALLGGSAVLSLRLKEAP